MLSDLALPLELDGATGDLTPFAALDDVAERARVAFIGEMDHFIVEKYAYRLLCLRYLVSRGWRWFGEEIPADRGRRADHYLLTGDERLLEPVRERPWFTRGVLANQSRPSSAWEAAQTRFMKDVRQVAPDTRWFGFDADSTNQDYLELANRADTYEQLRPAMARREEIMHGKVARVMSENPGEKVALMAAALHLAKDDDALSAPGVGAGPGGATVHSIGHFVAHNLTEQPVLSVWLLHGRGLSANPWLSPSRRLQPAPATFDEELLQRGCGPSLIPVGRDDRRRSVTQMHNLVMHCRFVDQVDAIVFVPEVHPLGEALS